jgi:hypothetical protein
LIFVVGVGLIIYDHKLFRLELEGIDKVQDTKLSKTVILPERRVGDLH